MGDRIWLGKPSRYVTATEVSSAFYPPWDGKMMSAFGLSNNNNKRQRGFVIICGKVMKCQFSEYFHNNL